MSVRFAKLTEDEQGAVDKIVRRARGMLPVIDEMSLRMDLSATHASLGLRLAELAQADDFNFTHDVCGIIYHMDRRTGELGDCFVPRFAVHNRSGR